MSNINERENNGGSIDNTAINNTAIDINGNSLDADKGDTINNTATDSNGNGDLTATDTTTVQPSNQTVRFERISNGTCDLTFVPNTNVNTTNNNAKQASGTINNGDIGNLAATDTTTQPNSVNILNVSFPYIFDPSDHGFNSVNGTYTFDCCGCPYVFVIDGEDNSVTTTTTEKDVTTTTSSSTTTTSSSTTTSTTTIKEGCDNCTTVRVRKANVKTPNTVTFNYTDCDNVSKSHTITSLRPTVDLCVCSGSIPSSNDYSIEFIETCTTGLPVLTCDLLQFTVNDGENGENVSYVNGSGLQILAQTSPQQYVLGQGTYTLTVTVPSGYSNAGDTLNCVTDEVIVTQGGGDTTTTSTKAPASNCYEITIQPVMGSEGILEYPNFEIWRKLPGDENPSYYDTSQSISNTGGVMRLCSTFAPTMFKNSSGELEQINSNNPEYTYEQLNIEGETDIECLGGNTTTTLQPPSDPFMFFEANQYECINGTTCEQEGMLVIVKSTESRPPGRWWNNGDGNVYEIIGISNETTANIDLSDAVAKFDCNTACSSSN